MKILLTELEDYTIHVKFCTQSEYGWMGSEIYPCSCGLDEVKADVAKIISKLQNAALQYHESMIPTKKGNIDWDAARFWGAEMVRLIGVLELPKEEQQEIVDKAFVNLITDTVKEMENNETS